MWEPGDYNRLMVDLCETMKSDVEPFYAATSTVHDCPFKKGVVNSYSFTSGNITSDFSYWICRQKEIHRLKLRSFVPII